MANNIKPYDNLTAARGHAAPHMGETDTNVFNQRWVPLNKLTAARDRNRINALGNPEVASPVELGCCILGDTNIMTNSPGITPIIPQLVNPEIPPINPAMVRRMGETTLDTRDRRNPFLWANTPAAPFVPASVGSTFILNDIFKNAQRAGAYWDFKANYLKVYFTDGNQYEVNIPASHIKRIFNAANRVVGKTHLFHGHTLEALFKELVRDCKASKRKTSVNGFFEDAGAWFENAGKDIAKVAMDIHKVTNDVIASKEFAAVMGAVSAVPPIGTLVGGIGMAAHGAAAATKPFVDKAQQEVHKWAAQRANAGKPPPSKKEIMDKGKEVMKNLVKKASASKATKKLVDLSVNSVGKPNNIMAAGLKSVSAATLKGATIKLNPAKGTAKIVSKPKSKIDKLVSVPRPKGRTITYGCECIDTNCRCKAKVV